MSKKQQKRKGNKAQKEFRKFSPEDVLAQMNERTFLEKIKEKFKPKESKPIKKIMFWQFVLLAALQAVFTLTSLGDFQFGSIVPATLAHLPPIIAAIFLGPAFGMGIGYVYAMFSLVYWIFFAADSPTSFLFSPFAQDGNFWSLVICIVPRVIYPYIIGKIFHSLKDKIKNSFVKRLWGAFSAGVGALCHSLMLIILWYVCFFLPQSSGINIIKFGSLMAGTNIIIEMAAAIVTGFLCSNKIMPKYYNDN